MGAAGYDVLGVDLSEDVLALAGARVPGGRDVLAAAGFERAARLDGYGSEPLPPGQLAYVACGPRERR